MSDHTCLEAHWARWVWSDTGPGRWHVIADTGIGLMVDPETRAVGFGLAVKTACNRVRELPEEHGVHSPPRDECCPECLSLDDLRDRLELAGGDRFLDDLTFAGHPGPKETVPV